MRLSIVRGPQARMAPAIVHPPFERIIFRDKLEAEAVEIVRHPEDMPDAFRGAVAALGNFDGVHRGHQAVLGEAGRRAREMGVPLGVITTEPHPRRYFRPDDPPFRLTPFRDRAQLFEGFGVDLLGCLTFDAALAAMSAQDFVRRVLLEGFGLLHVVVGFNYRFGRGRGGDAAVLGWMGEMEGFGVSTLSPVGDSGQAGEQVFSSSAIREALREGRPRAAAEMLGHWWTLSGHVLEGERRGRTIGFPTLNLALGEALRPALGVYAVRAVIDGLGGVRAGVANLGRRPTFGGETELLEVHLFDTDGDFYGRCARVEFVDFLRPERKFAGPEDLKTQIARDCEQARHTLKAPSNARAKHPPPTLDAYLATFPDPRA